MKKLLSFGLLLAVFVGCSVQNSYIYPDQTKKEYLITTGDTTQPYESLGFIQITKTGATLFGFVEILDANLKGMFGDALVKELKKSGADGIINLRFHETQYTTTMRVLFAIMLIIPLPNTVEVTGELIKFKSS